MVLMEENDAQSALTQLRAYLTQQQLPANSRLPPERELSRLLTAVLDGSPQARVVAFLQERGLATADAGTMIDDEEVEAAKTATPPSAVLDRREYLRPPRRGLLFRAGRFLVMLLLALALLAGAAVGTYALAPDWSRETVGKISAWMNDRETVKARPPSGRSKRRAQSVPERGPS